MPIDRLQLPVASQKSLVILTKVVVACVIVGALYFGKPILLPLALGFFLSILLTPLVAILQRRRLPRALAVVFVIALVAIILTGLVFVFFTQLTSLVDELPSHTENIKGKVRSVRGIGDGALFDRLDRMWTEVLAEWKDKPPGSEAQRLLKPEGTTTDSPSAANEPATAGGPSWLSRLPNLFAPVISGAVALGLAVVLAFFILLQREALRNRIIRLVGGSLVVTTKAVDDASERISRYLRMQLIVNSSYGAIWGLGLFFIGLDYALLWGFLAAILRFVPYIGPWISSVLPIIVALAQFSGWWQLLVILGLLTALELVSNNLVEPVLYGRSTGVSAVAMLISAAFWTFIWGPIGLLLSGPITVCLAVVGKHFPQLTFLHLILGDEPVLDPHTIYYQRLIARDEDEATQLAIAQAKEAPLDQVFDELLIPAFYTLKRDRARTDITEADEQFAVDTTREIIDDLVDLEAAKAADAETAAAKIRIAPILETDSTPRVCVMGYPARDIEDQLALEMLGRLLDSADWEWENVPALTLTGDWIERVAERNPAIVCIASIPPGGLAHTRYVCKRLRNRFPDLKIAVGRWGLPEDIELTHDLEEAGADHVARSLRETRDQLNGWLPVFDQQSRDAADDTGINGTPGGTARKQSASIS